jgi:hypothetical protein
MKARTWMTVPMRGLRSVIVVIAALSMTLSAVPAEAATNPAAQAATSAVSSQELGSKQADDQCYYGEQCFYDNPDGTGLLFRAARCDEHDLRGGPYQNKINYVINWSSADIYLDIWRNAGYWQQYAHIGPWDSGERIWTDDIDRIRLDC